MALVFWLSSSVEMDVRRIVGENLRQYRLSAKLSQEEMAARMGVEQSYLSGLEAGRRNPTIVSIYELATALGISHMELVRPTEGQ